MQMGSRVSTLKIIYLGRRGIIPDELYGAILSNKSPSTSAVSENAATKYYVD